MVVTLEDLEESIDYIDVKRLILIFAYVNSIDPNLFEIEFCNAADCIYEDDENADIIIEYIYDKNNQAKLFEWMIKNNETFISIDDKIYSQYR